MTDHQPSDIAGLTHEAIAASPLALHLMPLKVVRLEMLDEHGRQILVPSSRRRAGGPVVASGFLVGEGADTYVYTCWHVVTGIDLDHPVLPGTLNSSKRRMRIRVSLQANTPHSSGGVTIGGLETIELELYDRSQSPPIPLWEQDGQSVDNEALASANLLQPFWHDAVRIRLPAAYKATDAQTLRLSDLWHGLASPGDSVFVVGYPYGYSAMIRQPVPIVLRRSIAAVMRDGFRRDVLIDGGGAPGMSGGPVFLMDSGRLHLYGIYTGIVFPDAAPGAEAERTTALGTVCTLGLLGNLKFVGARAVNVGAAPGP